MSDIRTSLGVADKRQSAYPSRFEIMPTMELMAGVLSQTSWIRYRGPKGHGNEYFQALSRFMGPYRDHRAIRITESALSKGFTYDAHCAFICHFGPLPEMARLYDYGGSLSFRNLDPAMLDDLHDSLVELAELSRFTDFFEEWRDRLERMGECFSNDVDVSTIIDLLTDFFGWEQQTRPILAPAMFPGGGYGYYTQAKDGSMVGGIVIGARAGGTGKPLFLRGLFAKETVIHEIVHTYSDPCLMSHPPKAETLQRLFRPVGRSMGRLSYGHDMIFIRESVTRAITCLALKCLVGPSALKAFLCIDAAFGFYLNGFLVEQIEYYATHRDLYPTFADFVPHLSEMLDTYAVPKDPVSRARKCFLISRAAVEAIKLWIKRQL
jgi:hypothetical protein